MNVFKFNIYIISGHVNTLSEIISPSHLFVNNESQNQTLLGSCFHCFFFKLKLVCKIEMKCLYNVKCTQKYWLNFYWINFKLYFKLFIAESKQRNMKRQTERRNALPETISKCSKRKQWN